MQAFGKQASARVSHRRISSCIAGICSEFRKKRRFSFCKRNHNGAEVPKSVFIARAAVGAHWTAQTTQSVLKVIY
jgi:hypothetical protein